MEYRDLEKVRALIKDATNLDIVYAYDDMVFPDNTVFIFQYDRDNANNFFCFFQKECVKNEREKLMAALQTSATKARCTVVDKGTFTLKERGEEVDIVFN